MSFDDLAIWYRPLERLTFGRTLEKCRFHFLPTVRRSPRRHRRVLILGEGDGRFAERLSRAVDADAVVDVVDASRLMLRRTERRLRKAGTIDRVRLYHADAMGWSYPTAEYDLVVTHFFLDCFPPRLLNELVPRTAAACKADADWLLGDFRRPPPGRARVEADVWLAAMYGFFRLTTDLPARGLADPRPLLSAAGFAVAAQRSWRGGFVSTEWWGRTAESPFA
ncbi:MAG: class I SAM-dependent methyltransferase [Planctomycetia bacterium]